MVFKVSFVININLFTRVWGRQTNCSQNTLKRDSKRLHRPKLLEKLYSHSKLVVVVFFGFCCYGNISSVASLPFFNQFLFVSFPLHPHTLSLFSSWFWCCLWSNGKESCSNDVLQHTEKGKKERKKESFLMVCSEWWRNGFWLLIRMPRCFHVLERFYCQVRNEKCKSFLTHNEYHEARSMLFYFILKNEVQRIFKRNIKRVEFNQVNSFNKLNSAAGD